MNCGTIFDDDAMDSAPCSENKMVNKALLGTRHKWRGPRALTFAFNKNTKTRKKDIRMKHSYTKYGVIVLLILLTNSHSLTAWAGELELLTQRVTTLENRISQLEKQIEGQRPAVSTSPMSPLAPMEQSQIQKDIPTVEDIERHLVGRNTGEGVTSWTFAPEEPRQIKILDSSFKGNSGVITIDMYTEATSKKWTGEIIIHRVRGKLRLHYERIAGDWTLVKIENLSFAPVAS